jgi:pyruvyl transferase EpsO
LFCNGGGNFEDLYRGSQNIRLNAVKSLKDAKAIFLPQSVHYRNHNITAKDRVVFEAHKDLTMMFRDFESLEYIRKNMPKADSIFVPDMAFVLGPQLPNMEPVVDILVLIRSDIEASQSPSKHATQVA